jgi:hypothetical protein
MTNRTLWLTLTLISGITLIVLFAQVSRGAVGMPLGLLLAAPAVILVRLGIRKLRATDG